ncbi:F-box protein [Senna tora]|uniref:F-box protein n=1 Tax=Senna tora TaxID=362788 RepID=A0A835CJS9_9FABA|nr:F-box protein [Senna tora]
MVIEFENNAGLPYDIMVEILVRLSAYELMDLKLVCTQWRWSLRDPYFVRRHVDHWQSQHDGYLVSSIFGDHPNRTNEIIKEVYDSSSSTTVTKSGGNFRVAFGYVDNPSTRYILIIWVDADNINITRATIYNSNTRVWTVVTPPEFHLNISNSQALCMNGKIFWVSAPIAGSVDNNPYVVCFNIAGFTFSRFVADSWTTSRAIFNLDVIPMHASRVFKFSTSLLDV